MTYKYLLYKKDGAIGIVTLNRPEVLNALSGEVYDELYWQFQEIEEDPDVRVVIVTGSGEKAFIAGADIAAMQPQNSIEIRKNLLDRGRRAYDRVYSLSKPVIAAINGYAIGGGLELAMCCDLRIACESAKFGQAEINLAIIPGGGGTQRLTQLIGMTKAKELIFTGDLIDANTALSLGLINKIVPTADLMNEVMQLAQKLLSKSSVTLALAKKAINTSAETNLSSGLDTEEHCFALCFATEDQKEGMGAFLQKRKPEFKNK